MKLLILGNSSLVKRKLLPALFKIPLIENIELSTSFPTEEIQHLVSFIYDNHEKAIKTSRSQLVYISTTNESHFNLAKLSLIQGKHVVVDKPLALSIEERFELLQMARERGVLLSEAVVNLYHNQFSKVAELFLNNNDAPKYIQTSFIVPSFSSENFRNHKNKGGGVINDMLLYPIFLGNYFFNDKPISSNVDVISYVNDVEESISVQLIYPDNKILTGIFSFNGAYTNCVKVIGNKITISFDRVFSIPSDFRNLLTITKNLIDAQIKVEEEDSFELYLLEILSKINEGNYEEEYFKIETISEILKKI